MNKEIVRVRYDGPALSEHSMDVNSFAPALLSLGDLCTIANQRFNGDKASVRVMVRADLEAKCFDFGIELAQTVLEQVATFIKHDEVKTAKEILEWLGIVGTPILGVFQLLKVLDGKKINEKKLVVEDGKNIMQVLIEGDNNTINTHPEAVDLCEDPRVISGVQNVVKPLLNKGYDSLEFEHKEDPPQEITKEDAEIIMDVDPDSLADVEAEEEPQYFSGVLLKIYSPVFDPKKTKWKFDFDGKPISVDISETTIAEDTVQRGEVNINDIYKVDLEVTQSITRNSQILYRYKIIKVHDFKPGKSHPQGRLFSESQGSEEKGED